MHSEKIDYKNLRNMRDLGGLPAMDGKHIKKGRLIRSGRLYNLPKETVDFLNSLNLDIIIDMRTQKEVEEHFPTLLEGPEYHYIPFVFTADPDVVPTKSASSTVLYRERKRLKREFADADQYMQKMYSEILFSPSSIKKINKIFSLFAEEDKRILFHCNSGKDRTGIIAMLLESILGVPDDVILEEYLVSYRFMIRRRKKQLFWIKVAPMSIKFKNVLRAMIYAKPQYILGAIDEIKQKYGSIENYLISCVKISEEDIKKIRSNYLE